MPGQSLSMEIPPCSGDSLNLATPRGKIKCNLDQYLNMVHHCCPDIWSTPTFDIPFYSSRKQITKCVNMTLNWLKLILEGRDQREINCLEKSKIWISIQGSKSNTIQSHCIQSVLMMIEKYNAKEIVSGVVLNGLGWDENNRDRKGFINLTINQLPTKWIRTLPNIQNPDHILDAVGSGIDLFVNHYPEYMARNGYAITFRIHRSTLEKKENGQKDDIELEGKKKDQTNQIFIHDPGYAIDFKSLVEDCECYTCKTHHRSYLHHLARVHEMQGQALLIIHNTHHYLAFFKAIRKAIKTKTFKSYNQWFSDQYRIDINEGQYSKDQGQD